MNEAEFRQELKHGLSGVYFFYGEEEYLKKFYGGRAQTQTVGEDADIASWNTYTLEGKKAKREPADLDSLEEAVNAVPMMGDKVFVRYTADLSAFTDGEIEELLRIIGETDPERTVLLIVVPPDGFDPGRPEKGKPSALYRKLSALCKPVDMCRMKPGELRKWMGRRLGKDGITLSPDAAEALVMRSGSSMFALSGELDKLAAYALANSMTEIDGETVKLVSEVNEEDEAFAMANAVMNGDRRKALKALHRCKAAREEPLAVMGMVAKSLCDMLTVCCLMEDGADKKEISEKMKMHEYRAGLFMNSVRNANPRQLTATLGRCREADLKMKGSVPGYTALERFICTIPAQNRR